MKKVKCVLVAFFLLFLSCFFFIPAGHAAIEWKIDKQLNLSAPPLDVASSPDGKMIFVLTKGEILVYSGSGLEPTDHIPVDAGFDRLSYSPDDKMLILTSSTDKKLVSIEFDQVYAFDMTGLPFKGPANAPVTLAVFTDYQ